MRSPRLALACLSLLPLACSTTPLPGDGGASPDLARPPERDLSAPEPDLAAPLPDLASPADLFACKSANPAGCKQTGCPKGQVCDPTVGCKASQCQCDAKSGQWICTEDCGGGTCVPPSDGGAACPPPNPQGCKNTGCPKGSSCVIMGCKPSSCTCQNGGWACTKDCGGGECVVIPVGDGGTPGCAGMNPAGCKQTGCPMGKKCDPTVGCKPSACGCDPGSGQWFCTADCGGGTCV